MRLVVAITCFGLIIARAVWPEIRFDNISLTLLAITALAVLLPELRKHLGPVKTVKIGPFEVELERCQGDGSLDNITSKV